MKVTMEASLPSASNFNLHFLHTLMEMKPPLNLMREQPWVVEPSPGFDKPRSNPGLVLAEPSPGFVGFVEPRAGFLLEPRAGFLLEPRAGFLLEPRAGFLLEPRRLVPSRTQELGSFEKEDAGEEDAGGRR
ncbi:hypothetical protein SLEP1_g32942 [Rubroshorea leprosula]|uniref:Uncharacterized protein n=1 Tax=Rubroshorea leprosula TaxID=152421 RepID=A0AAV5KF28_9ROSI|nr:hypothetical protein SLEP1_g32942 [Rubroshorea leprosula]